MNITKEQIIYKIDSLIKKGEVIATKRKDELFTTIGIYTTMEYCIGEITIHTIFNNWFLGIMNVSINIPSKDITDIYQYVDSLYAKQSKYEKEQKIKKINKYLKQ